MMDKQDGIIYSTFDYEKFKFLEENRDVKMDRVQKVIASMTERLAKTVIVVNAKFEIIDGQHRFTALKELGLPIRYEIDPDATIEDCRRMNRYNKPWDSMDWIHHWAKNKNPDIAQNYKNLLTCIHVNKVNISRALKLGGVSSHNGHDSTSRLINGTLKYSSDKIAKVTGILKVGNEIIDALATTNRTNEAFWVSVKVLTETDGYDHLNMLENCKKLRGSYAQASNIENQLAEFSRIYNYKVRKTSKLFFEDYMRNKGYNVRTYDDYEYDKT